MRSEKLHSIRDHKLAVLAAGLALLATVGVMWWLRGSKLTIGVEGRRIATLPGPRLSAAPFTHGDAVSLRIAEAQPTKDGFRYDLRFVTYGPGEYDLRDYLVRDDHQPISELPELPISVASILPRDHQSELWETGTSEIDLNSSHRTLMGLLTCLWGLLLIPLWLWGRPPRRAVIAKPPPPSPRERLAALLEQATRGPLSVEQQADLERLLVTFWSRRLQLADHERLTHTFASLRSHPVIGRQLSRVESWLHSRATASSDIAAELLNDLNAPPVPRVPINNSGRDVSAS